MKYIVNIIALCVLAVGILAVIKFKDSDAYYAFEKKMESVGKGAGEFMEAKKKTVQMEMAPTRRRPITFIEQEEKLMMFAPNVFEGFSEASWSNFWDFIYELIEDNSGKYPTKRHRTKEEIKEFLINQFPKPFSQFRQDHWHYFWEIVLGNE
jgi:hypothetical protein